MRIPTLTFVLGLAVGLAVGAALGGRWKRTGPSSPTTTSAAEKPTPAASPDAPPSLLRRPPAAPVPSPSTDPGPAKAPDPQLEPTTDAEALEKYSGHPWACLEYWKNRLLVASPREAAELERTIASLLRTLPSGERARRLNALLKSGGWLSEKPGPLLRGELLEVLCATVREPMETEPHRDLMRALGEQVMRQRNRQPFAELAELAPITLAEERARLEGAAPPSDGAPVYLEQFRSLARRIPPGELRENETLGLLGLGSPSSGPEEIRGLLDLSTHANHSVRVAAVLGLARAPESPEVTGGLAKMAADPATELRDRLLAWVTLRRRGAEGAISLETRRELLDRWSETGKGNLVDLLGD